MPACQACGGADVEDADGELMCMVRAGLRAALDAAPLSVAVSPSVRVSTSRFAEPAQLCHETRDDHHSAYAMQDCGEIQEEDAEVAAIDSQFKARRRPHAALPPPIAQRCLHTHEFPPL